MLEKFQHAENYFENFKHAVEKNKKSAKKMLKSGEQI